MTPDELHTLTLHDGLPVTREGRELRYRTVRLRETDVNDERLAARLAERVVTVAGVPKLMVSDREFQLALTMRHVAAFECEGQRIEQAMIDLELFGKLSSHDLGEIEARVFLVNMAAEARYGNIQPGELDAILSGQKQQPPDTPQPVGQAAGVGRADPDPEPGPALLADFTRSDTDGQAAGDGR